MEENLDQVPEIAKDLLERDSSPEQLTPLQVLEKRKEEGYVPGSKSDGNCVAVALGPGGWAGVTSLGEALELEQSGLLDCVDMFYGVSVGAINAMYVSTRQFKDGYDVYTKHMPKAGKIPKSETLRSAIFSEYPLDEEALSSGVPVVIGVTNLDKFGTKIVRSDEMESEAFMEWTLRASHLPYVGGPPPTDEEGTHYSDSSLSL